MYCKCKVCQKCHKNELVWFLSQHTVEKDGRENNKKIFKKFNSLNANSIYFLSKNKLMPEKKRHPYIFLDQNIIKKLLVLGYA